MIKIQINYTDGSYKIKEFESWKAIYWYVFTEGDHVVDYHEVASANLAASTNLNRVN